MPFFTLVEFRRKFWTKVPSPMERRRQMKVLIDEARREFLRQLSDGSCTAKDHPSQLIFKANGKEMCEQAFVNMLGLHTVHGFRSKTWVDVLRECLGMSVIYLYICQLSPSNLYVGFVFQEPNHQRPSGPKLKSRTRMKFDCIATLFKKELLRA